LYAASQLVEATKNLHGKTVAIEYVRDGVESTTDVTLRNENGDGKGYLGLGLSQEKPTTFRSTWSAPIVGVALTGQFTWYTLQSLGDVFVKFVTGLVDQVSFNSSTREAGSAKLGEAGSSVGGPVALIGTIFPAALAGGGISLMLVTAFIALTLAVMNALPIPALDGGRWFVTFWYHKVLKKPLSKEKEEKIHGTGFMILMGLFVLVTIADVMKLW
jgi:regulator of sigma E protease